MMIFHSYVSHYQRVRSPFLSEKTAPPAFLCPTVPLPFFPLCQQHGGMVKARDGLWAGFFFGEEKDCLGQAMASW